MNDSHAVADAAWSLRESRSAGSQRILAVDWMRGFVLILMTLDHASHSFNAGRNITDGVSLYDPKVPLVVTQFCVRLITHLCLPMFMFLAGVALAISTERRQTVGASPRDLDRHIMGRGALLLVLDCVWMSWVWSPREGLMFGALSAIGLSILAMVGLRRCSSRTLLFIAVGLLLSSELLCGVFLAIEGPISRFPVGFFLTGRHFRDIHVMISEPPLPWFPVLVLGWVCQKQILSRPMPWRRLAPLSGFLLAVFALVRWHNGYGNMALLRVDGSLLQYLHISKYPASLSYLSLTLGVGLLILSLLLWLEAQLRRRWTEILPWSVVLGQTALFYYLVHVHLLQVVAWASGLYHRGTLRQTLLAAVIAVTALYPITLGFQRLRRRYPESVLRYL